MQAYLNEENNGFPLVFGGIVWVLVNFFLFSAACSDPGFIPKQADDEHTYLHKHKFDNWLLRDGIHGQTTHLLKIKYCYTCNIYRPKRAIHCSECDTCIQQMDHHCPFISTCVGMRNYSMFFFFCLSLWVDTLFLFTLTI